VIHPDVFVDGEMEMFEAKLNISESSNLATSEEIWKICLERNL